MAASSAAIDVDDDEVVEVPAPVGNPAKRRRSEVDSLQLWGGELKGEKRR